MTSEARTLAIAILGGLIGVAAILAVVLGTSEAPANHPSNRAVFYSPAGLFAFDPETGEPHAPVSFEEDRQSHWTAVAGNLIWRLTIGPRPDGSGATTGVVVRDGTAIGLGQSGWPPDESGLVARWYLPDPADSAWVLVPLGGASTDGRTLYAFRRGSGEGAELWKFELGHEDPILLSSSFERGPLYISAAGRLFLQSTQPDQLIELDTTDGRELGRIELPHSVGYAMFAADGTHLYLGTTVVDLDRMAIVEELALPDGVPAPSLGRWGRALSPDRTRLYLAGDDPESCADEVLAANGSRTCRPQPLGVQVIDLATMEVLYNDPTANLLALSADGRRLVTSLWTSDQEGGPYREQYGDGLKVVDTDTLEVLAHFDPGGPPILPFISANGRFAYTYSEGPGRELVRPWEECPADCTAITVYDLDRLELVATHINDGANWVEVDP